MAVVSDFTALLNEYGLRWNPLTSVGQPAVVTYSFTQTVPGYKTATDYPGLQVMNEAQKNQVRQAIQIFDSVAGIDFVEVPDSDQVQIRLGLHNFAGTAMSSAAGYANYPNITPIGGDTWFDTRTLPDFAQDTWRFETVLHELGHAIGLKHPFEGPTTLVASLDNSNYTLMSYTDAGTWKTAPQVLDIEATAYYYGAAATTENAVVASYVASSGKIRIDVTHHAGQTVTGSNSADLIVGGAGNDVLAAGGGLDVLNGGDGADMALYYGPRSAYRVTVDNGLYAVASTTTGWTADVDGTDYLLGVETIGFRNYQTASSDGSGVDAYNLATLAIDQSAANRVYRFFNAATSSHFFTASVEERNTIVGTNPTLVYEGAAFGARQTPSGGAGEISVYRFLNTATGSHFYTASAQERDSIIASLPAFAYEGVAYYAYGGGEASIHTALHRFFNTANGTHFFTASAAEKDNIIATLGQYRYEGIAYYVDV